MPKSAGGGGQPGLCIFTLKLLKKECDFSDEEEKNQEELPFGIPRPKPHCKIIGHVNGAFAAENSISSIIDLKESEKKNAMGIAVASR